MDLKFTIQALEPGSSKRGTSELCQDPTCLDTSGASVPVATKAITDNGISLNAQALPIKVALLTNCIAPYSHPVLRILKRSVAQLRVFVSTPMEDDRQHWEPIWDGLDVTLQRSITTHHTYSSQAGFSKTFARHFPYDCLPLLYQWKPDLVISAQLGFRTMQAIAYRLLNPSGRLIIWADLSEHTEREIGMARTIVRRFLLNFADAVMVNGRSGLRYLKRLGVSEDRIVLAPYVSGLTTSDCRISAREERVARRLLFVGQLIELKGLQNFVDVLFGWARDHSDQTCELWFLGDGPLRKVLEDSPAPANVQLRFFGNVPYSEVPHYYAQAGILVFPTLSDTWGLVVNEALGAGLPILGSRYSEAVEELITDGWNGWTFFPDRPEELRAALNNAMGCPISRLAEMSEAARQSVRHMTPAYSANCFTQAIRIAMKTSRKQRASSHE